MLLADGHTIAYGAQNFLKRDIALKVTSERGHHADSFDRDAVFMMHLGLAMHRGNVVGVAAVEVFAAERIRRRQRDRSGNRKLFLEFERPFEAAFVEPERGIMDAVARREASDDVFRIRPPRHELRIDERARLDVAKAGVGKRLNQFDLVSSRDRGRFDLEALTRAFLMYFDAGWQIGHGRLPRLNSSGAITANRHRLHLFRFTQE